MQSTVQVVSYIDGKRKKSIQMVFIYFLRSVPLHGILFTGGMFLLGLCLHFFVADSRMLFQLLAGMTTVCFLFVWSSILCAHFKLRINLLQKNRDKVTFLFFLMVGLSLFFESATPNDSIDFSWLVYWLESDV